MKKQSGGAQFAQDTNFSNVGSPAQATEPEKPSFGDSFSVGPSLSTVGGGSTTPAAGKPVILLGPSPLDMLQKQAADIMGLFGAFRGSLHGAAKRAIARASGNGIISNSLTLLVDSGSTSNDLDSDLAPGLKYQMADYKELEQPHKVITAVKHILEGVETGTVKGAVTGKDGHQQHVGLADIVVPGLGQHLFSATAAVDTGAVTTVEAKLRLEMGGITLPTTRTTRSLTHLRWTWATPPREQRCWRKRNRGTGVSRTSPLGA